MQEIHISLPTAERVQSFVEAITPLEGNFDLISGKYVLDARSLMGIFSLDLSQPILLKIYNDTKENMAALRPFAANQKEPQP